MGAAFGFIYVIVIFVIIAKVIKNAGKNGKSIFGSPGQSQAYQAVMSALEKGADAAGNNLADKGRNTDSVVARPEQNTSAVSAGNQPVRSVKKESFLHSNMMSKEPPINKLMDDREHDWLAGQLKEERDAKKRMSDMFELKAYHAANCDAEVLKRFHAAYCDAEGIDTAQG